MFFISYIKNNKASIFLILVWTVLLYFGAISFTPPKWLVDISMDGKSSEAYDLNLEANSLLKQKEYTKAISLYNAVLRRNPNLISAQVNLATAYSKSGNLDLAANTYESLLKDSSNMKSVIYYNLAEVYEKSGNFELAIKNYLISTETAPYPIYAYQKTGELLMNRNMFNKAIVAFDQALENKLDMRNSYIGMIKREFLSVPSNSLNSYGTIRSHYNSCDFFRFDKDIFESILSSNKNLAKTYNNIGYCYAMTNRLVESIEYFNKSLEISANFSDAKRNLNIVKSKLSDNQHIK